MRQRKLGFIGGGVMAEVILKGILARQVFQPEQIWVYDVDSARREKLAGDFGVQIASGNEELVATVDVVLAAVKPQVVEPVLRQINADLWAGKMLVSIAAGISIASLAAWTSPKISIARIIPNTPCQVGQGMSAISFNDQVTAEEKQITIDIFGSVGEICLLEEELLNAATGVSGSGPAYIYLIAEALMDGGVKAGLPRPICKQLVVQTLLGAAAMIKETGRHPGELKDMVTSPGGTTIEALASLERDGVRAALIKAVEVAVNRAEVLGKK